MYLPSGLGMGLYALSSVRSVSPELCVLAPRVRIRAEENSVKKAPTKLERMAFIASLWPLLIVLRPKEKGPLKNQRPGGTLKIALLFDILRQRSPRSEDRGYSRRY